MSIFLDQTPSPVYDRTMQKALYAFSGDPITFGHIDIIKRASRAFDKVIVGIGVNPDKQYTFTLEERTDMARHVLTGLLNVEVTPFQGLLVDFAYENGAQIIVKGVRNSADFNYETILHQMGESQKLGIDTHILIARPELAHISSSSVKAMQKEHGLIHEFVPLYVKQCLEKKLSGQYIISVTGEIGSGKSYISRKLIELGAKEGIEVHNIELDHIGHRITNALMEPQYIHIRNEIIKLFGKDVAMTDGFINRKVLGDIVFNDQEALDKLNDIMAQPISVRLRREIYGKKGLILINAALIAESDMSYLSNNNVILVSTDKEQQRKRLLERGLEASQIERRLETQYPFQEKQKILEDIIKRDNQGKVWTVDNIEGSDSSVKKLMKEILEYLTIKAAVNLP